AGAVVESNYAYNPITCLEDTEFPLNDQIIAGIGINRLMFADIHKNGYQLIPSFVSVCRGYSINHCELT
ncbi:MAG: hypothetical protein WBG74_06575, partial [Shewanella sp.]